MTCTSCGDKPKGSSKGFPRAVVEINNPESLVLLRKVVIPASMGTEEDVPPTIGKYFNVILQYESNGHIYLYSSDGIPTAIEANIPQEVLDRIDQLEIDVDILETGLANETTAREAADSALSSSIESLSSSLSAETTARQTADTTLQNNITAEATARANADTALGNRVTAIEEKIPTQATAQNQLADKNFVNSSIATNTANFIGTFNSVAELEAYTGTVTNNDYAFVIVTDAQGNTAYDRYKYNGDTQQWLFEYELNNSSFTANQWAAINSGITSGDVTKLAGLANIQTIGANLALTNGELSATDTTYTAGANVQISNQNVISATDTTYTAGSGLSLAGTEFSADTTVLATQTDLATKQDVLTAGSNVQINNNIISATDTTYTAGTGIAINNGVISATSTGPTVVQTAGTSTTDVMSQNAVTSMVFADPGAQNKICIGGGTANGSQAVAVGFSAQAGGNTAVALGKDANAGHTGSVALGATTRTSGAGQVNIGPSSTFYGYNSSNYRLLTGVYDGQSAHDAATKGQLDAAVNTIDTALDAKQDELTPGTGISITEESGALVISSTGGGADVFTNNEWNTMWA